MIKVQPNQSKRESIPDCHDRTKNGTDVPTQEKQ